MNKLEFKIWAGLRAKPAWTPDLVNLTYCVHIKKLDNILEGDYFNIPAIKIELVFTT